MIERLLSFRQIIIQAGPSNCCIKFGGQPFCLANIKDKDSEQHVFVVAYNVGGGRENCPTRNWFCAKWYDGRGADRRDSRRHTPFVWRLPPARITGHLLFAAGHQSILGVGEQQNYACVMSLSWRGELSNHYYWLSGLRFFLQQISSTDPNDYLHLSWSRSVVYLIDRQSLANEYPEDDDDNNNNYHGYQY